MQITYETLVLRSQEDCGFTPLHCDWLLISLSVLHSVLHILIQLMLKMNMIELLPQFKDQEINILQFSSLYGEQTENENLLGLQVCTETRLILTLTINLCLSLNFSVWDARDKRCNNSERFLGDRFLPKASLARMAPTTY